MIKVITGYKLKKDSDIEPILAKLRSYAISFAGFVSAENLLNEDDNSIVAMVTTWERIENWRTWENTRIRHKILKEAEALLEEPVKVTIYKIMPTMGWVYTPQKS